MSTELSSYFTGQYKKTPGGTPVSEMYNPNMGTTFYLDPKDLSDYISILSATERNTRPYQKALNDLETLYPEAFN